MKKLFSLIKACLSSDMALFKIKGKGKKSSTLIPLFIALYLMFMIWGSASSIYEKLTPLHIQYVVLPLFVISISAMTFLEGIYKAGPMIFNCKDDNLLLSLPITKRTVLFIRILKFYLFEFMFNGLFLFPAMVAYIRWADSLNWTYFLSSIIMLILFPIIPIVLSCIWGMITSSFSSRFRFKNVIQIVISMIFILAVLVATWNTDSLMNYLIEHASSLNDFITKIYYPAGVYAKLITDFHVSDLLICILIHIALFAVTIYILSLFYFRINSRMKRVISNKKVNVNDLVIKKRSQTASLIKKELNTFFQTPVFIINSGFALVLFLLVVILACFKFDTIVTLLTSEEMDLGLSKDAIATHMSTLIFVLISLTAFMTSITNCVVSLEGKNINILKSLPVKVKTILMSKIYACSCITTPVLLVGDIILFIRFQIPILEAILLFVLSILIPFVSHFIGIIINLKYPKLDWENPAEVVKQSTSSFTAVMLGMGLFILTVIIASAVFDIIPSLYLLILMVFFFAIVDYVLYTYLMKRGVKEFNQLSV